MRFRSTSETVAWLRDRYREGALTLKPPYQRHPVWAERQKSFLIESILTGYPVPEIFIQESTTGDGETSFAVVDGQQRVRTIFQFVGADLDQSEPEANNFSLDKLPANSQWYDATFDEFGEPERRRFYSYQVAIRFLETDDESEVRELFKRMNKNVVPLNPQELRNATYQGPFPQLAEQLADNEYWASNGIVTAASIRRMGDIEFASELLIGVMHGPQAGSPKAIDAYYELYEDYEDEFPGQKRARTIFDATLRRIQIVLPQIRGTRWDNKTDFYSLFVALAYLTDTQHLRSTAARPIRTALDVFANEVNSLRTLDRPSQTSPAGRYLRAVQRGANDKNRRAERHGALLAVLEPFFQ